MDAAKLAEDLDEIVKSGFSADGKFAQIAQFLRNYVAVRSQLDAIVSALGLPEEYAERPGLSVRCAIIAGQAREAVVLRAAVEAHNARYATECASSAIPDCPQFRSAGRCCYHCPRRHMIDVPAGDARLKDGS